MTTNWESLSFDIMLPNAHKNIEIISIEKESWN